MNVLRLAFRLYPSTPIQQIIRECIDTISNPSLDQLAEVEKIVYALCIAPRFPPTKNCFSGLTNDQGIVLYMWGCSINTLINSLIECNDFYFIFNSIISHRNQWEKQLSASSTTVHIREEGQSVVTKFCNRNRVFAPLIRKLTQDSITIHASKSISHKFEKDIGGADEWKLIRNTQVTPEIMEELRDLFIQNKEQFLFCLASLAPCNKANTIIVEMFRAFFYTKTNKKSNDVTQRLTQQFICPVKPHIHQFDLFLLCSNNINQNILDV